VNILERARSWARRIKRDGLTLWFAGKHPATPWYAKALGAFVVAYALSPLDLIPDFIPILGYVDDVILLPVLVWITVRLLPTEVLEECRTKAEEWMASSARKPRSLVGAVAVVSFWLLTTVLLGAWAITYFNM